jgi:hypothetical protein
MNRSDSIVAGIVDAAADSRERAVERRRPAPELSAPSHPLGSMLFPEAARLWLLTRRDHIAPRNYVDYENSRGRQSGPSTTQKRGPCSRICREMTRLNSVFSGLQINYQFSALSFKPIELPRPWPLCAGCRGYRRGLLWF